jgi:hypothetical protein
MHDISQVRMFGTSRKNLTMFNKLCGDTALKNVILATTKWDGIEPSVGLRREQQLYDTYWKKMLIQGSKMARFIHTYESAWAIIDLILNKDPVDALLIQEELIDLQKLLPETEAGTMLRYMLQELLEDQRDVARRLRNEYETQGSEVSQEKLEEISKRRRSTLHQLRELKLPLGRRILTFFFC